jgi:hypothetical protein
MALAKLTVTWGTLLLFAVACKKERTPLEQLPAATQEGKNTGGWLLHDKAWIPKRSTLSRDPPVGGFWRKTKGGHSLAINFQQFTLQEVWGIGLFIPDIHKAGTFPLQEEPNITLGLRNTAYGLFYQRVNTPAVSYYTNPQAPGHVVITRFDTLQNIVSGTFEMTPQLDGGTTTIAITQGRFDLHFNR